MFYSDTQCSESRLSLRGLSRVGSWWVFMVVDALSFAVWVSRQPEVWCALPTGCTPASLCSGPSGSFPHAA